MCTSTRLPRVRILVGATLSLATFFIMLTLVHSATYNFSQTSWTGGADDVSIATHASNQSNWNKYATSTGLEVGSTLQLTSTTFAFTDDGATSTSPSSPTSGGGFSNGTLSNTIVNGSYAGASVGLTPLNVAVNKWNTLWPTIPGSVSSDSSMIRNGTEDAVYILQANNTTSFYKYSVSTNTWTTLATVPGAVNSGSSMIRNSSDNDIYVTGGVGTGFYKYSISTNSWTTLAGVPGNVSTGSSMIRNSSDNDIYVTGGGSNTGFYKYSISGNSWTTLAVVPGSVYTGSGMIRNSSDNDIYVTGGNGTGFYKYSISGNSWTTLAVVPGRVYYGGKMIRNGIDDSIYVLQGFSSNFYKYSISTNSWTTLAVVPAGGIGWSSSILRNGTDNDIYVAGGGSNLYKYSISTNSWTILTLIPSGFTYTIIMTRNGPDNDIYVMGDNGFNKYSISSNSWTGTNTSTLTSAPGAIGVGSNTIRNSSDNDIYVTGGDGNTGFYKYSVSTNTWTTLATVPGAVNSGSSMIRNSSDNDIYVTGGVGTGFYKYSISGNSWTTLTVVSGAVTDGSKMIRNSSDNDIYVTGGNGTGFYKYSISGNSWTNMMTLPGAISQGGTMIRNSSDNDIYVTGGGGNTGFYKYSISGNSWTTLAIAPGAVNYGSSMIRNSSDNDIYVTQGYYNTGFYKYSISGNSWTALAVAPGGVASGSTMIRNSSDNDIYVTQGILGTGFYKYSISGNSWTKMMSVPGMISQGSTMIRNSSDNEIYVTGGGSGNTGFYKFTIQTTTYPTPSGSFLSSVINLTNGAAFSTVAYTKITPINTTFTFDVHAGNTPTPDGSWSAWTTGITSGANISSLAGYKYFQYRVNLGTADVNVTPLLNDVTINYNQYASSGTLVSSVYDTGSVENIISNMRWNATGVTTNETVKFQVRSASTTDLLATAPWCGTGTCDGTTYFTDSTGGTVLDVNHPLRSGRNDEFFQYRVVLSSGGIATPTLTSANVQYVVNAPPNFDASYGTNGVTVSQVATTTDPDWGKVHISYSVRDTDGTTGTITPSHVTPSFEYNTGSGWIAIASSSMATGDTANKAVDNVTYTTYSATWSASTTSSDLFSSTTQIRVTINDNEGANNITTAISAPFVLDTKPPLAITIFDSSTGTTTDTMTLSTIDDSQSQYRLCNDIAFPDTDIQGNSCAWTALSSNISSTTISWIPNGHPNNEVIYLETKDALSNTTSKTIVIPSMPANFDFKDVSNVSIGAYREFLSWSVFQDATSSTFAAYKLYHSIDGVNYTILTTITNQAINYYKDDIVTSTTSTHFYKALAIDTDGDISDFTTVMSDVPNGQGSSDTTAPTIDPTSIITPINDLKNSSVRVTFTTDEIAKGEVQYKKSTESSWTNVPSLSYVLAQSIYLQGLEPNTTYNLQVKAEDVAGNVSPYVKGPDFTTVGGPLITGVNTINLTDNSVTIFWNTSTSSDSYVYYSKNQNIVPLTTAWSAMNVPCVTDICQHKIDIIGLTPGTKYYYYIKSTDSTSNSSTDNNNGSYYTFSTTLDVNPPVISNVTNPVISSIASVITWQTDEPASTQVQWGTASGQLTHSTILDITKSIYHVVALSKDTTDTNSLPQSLTPSTPYFFKVFSIDPAGNQSSSTEQTFTTTKDGEVMIVTQYVGGGGFSSPPTPVYGAPDTTAPTVATASTTSVGAFSAEVTLTTDEDSRAFIQYGETSEYSDTIGNSDWNTSKVMKLKRLQTGTIYHYRIKVSDKAGNDTVTEDHTFTTLFISELLADRSFLDKATDLQGKLEALIESALPSLSPPFLSTPELVNIGESSATISWNTNIKTIGHLRYASDEEYVKNKDYTLDVPMGLEKETKHTVDLANLKPNTKYHIQAKSYVFPQLEGKREDIIFVTKAAKIKASIAEKKNDGFTVVWSTDEPTTSVVDYKNTKTGDKNRLTDDTKKLFHSVKIDKLPSATTYEVAVSGLNDKGNIVESSEILRVKTSSDTVAPIITNFKVDNALVPGRNDRIQTVVGWMTNESANSIVYYEEGAGSSASSSEKELANKIEALDSYLMNHIIIIPNLKPGSIYRIKVTSADESGNTKTFGPRTIITPRQTESVLDVIFKNFEDTFKFLRK